MNEWNLIFRVQVLTGYHNLGLLNRHLWYMQFFVSLTFLKSHEIKRFHLDISILEEKTFNLITSCFMNFVCRYMVNVPSGRTLQTGSWKHFHGESQKMENRFCYEYDKKMLGMIQWGCLLQKIIAQKYKPKTRRR